MPTISREDKNIKRHERPLKCENESTYSRLINFRSEKLLAEIRYRPAYKNRFWFREMIFFNYNSLGGLTPFLGRVSKLT